MRKVLLPACLLITITSCAPARSETPTASLATATLASTPIATTSLAPSLTPSPIPPPTITPTPSPTDQAWLARITSTLRGLRKWPAGYSELWDLGEGSSISPDGRWLASVVWDDDHPLNGGEIVVISLIGPERVFREHLADTNITRTSSVAAWSPDGNGFVLFRSDYPLDARCAGEITELVVIQATGLKRFTYDWGEKACPWAVWSPDSSHVLFVATRADGGHDIWIVEAATGARVKRASYRADLPMRQPVAWTPKGFFFTTANADALLLGLENTNTGDVSTVMLLPPFPWPVTPGRYDSHSNSTFLLFGRMGDLTSWKITRLSLDPLRSGDKVPLPFGLWSAGAASHDPGDFAALISGGKLWIFNSADSSVSEHGKTLRLVGWFTNIAGFLVIARPDKQQPYTFELRIVRP